MHKTAPWFLYNPIKLATYSLGSPGPVEVPETTSSFSQVGKALVKP